MTELGDCELAKEADGAGPNRSYIIGAARFEAEPLAPGLYVVATPIGNLGDITLRALATLAAAETILCEDTRTSGKLMQRFAIKTRLSPYHEHNAQKVRPAILDRLRQGAVIALISDAGMPLVSDPGYRLVREATELALPVTFYVSRFTHHVPPPFHSSATHTPPTAPHTSPRSCRQPHSTSCDTCRGCGPRRG